jgi:hypothetical protein
LVSTGEPLSRRSHVTVADDPETVTAVTLAEVSDACGLLAWPARTEEYFEPFWSRLSLVAVGVLALKNATQLTATVFASPVRLAGTPEGVPDAVPDEEADAEAAGAEVAGAEVAGADVAAAEVAAGADVDELELLLQAVAVSARHATAAVDTATDCHLDRRISILTQASPSWLVAGLQSTENLVLFLETVYFLL